MTKEAAERAAEILRYLNQCEDEIEIWHKATSVDHVVLRYGGETYKVDSQQDFAEIKRSRLNIIQKLKNEWNQELENL